MNIWTYTLDTPLEWLMFIAILLVVVVLYSLLVFFIRKYTTGMAGGFFLMLVGLGLVMGPAFYLIRTETPEPEVVLSTIAIIMGCISVLVGAFSLTNFNDF